MVPTYLYAEINDASGAYKHDCIVQVDGIFDGKFHGLPEGLLPPTSAPI